MKTPYKYIEENVLIKGSEGYFDVHKPWEMISPIMSCILEQFRAKVLGELISTEAAGVVLGYLKRVISGLMGKMRGGEWLRGVVVSLGEGLQEAKGKGQARLGLRRLLRGMNGDLDKVFGSDKGEVKAEGQTGEQNDEVELKMIDDE